MKQARLSIVCFVVLCGALALAVSADAQLPTTQLTSIFPAGGKQGASVDVTVAGADLDDCSQLKFNQYG